MLTLEFTAEEARTVVEVIVAWGADDCPVGAIDTEALRVASDKLTAAVEAEGLGSAGPSTNLCAEYIRGGEIGSGLSRLPGRPISRGWTTTGQLASEQQ